jgi:hypothetical protein
MKTVVGCSTPITKQAPLHGEQAQTIVHGGGSGRAGVANKGFKHQVQKIDTAYNGDR